MIGIICSMSESTTSKVLLYCILLILLYCKHAEKPLKLCNKDSLYILSLQSFDLIPMLRARPEYSILAKGRVKKIGKLSKFVDKRGGSFHVDKQWHTVLPTLQKMTHFMTRNVVHIPTSNIQFYQHSNLQHTVLPTLHILTHSVTNTPYSDTQCYQHQKSIQ